MNRWIVKRWPGGLEVQFSSGVDTDPEEKKETELRGDVVGFSARSRSRLMREFARLDVGSGSVFCTLTLSDAHIERLGTDTAALAAFLKRGQKALLKRASRKFGADALSGIWRMEIVPRKSGRFAGVMVPHLHWLCTVHPGSVVGFRRWLAVAWWDVCGRAEDGHARAGVQADLVFSRRHAAFYLAKYAAKEAFDKLAVGRRWGTFGTPRVLLGERVVLFRSWVALRRLLRRWLRDNRYVGRVLRSESLRAGAFVFTDRDVGRLVAVV